MRVELGIELTLHWYLYRVKGDKIYLNEVQLLNEGIPENLDEAVNMIVTLYNFKFGYKKVIDCVVSNNIITIALTTDLLKYLGDYRLVAEYDLPDTDQPDLLRHSKVDSLAYTVVLPGLYVNDADSVIIKSVLSGSTGGESLITFAKRFGFIGSELELADTVLGNNMYVYLGSYDTTDIDEAVVLTNYISKFLQCRGCIPFGIKQDLYNSKYVFFTYLKDWGLIDSISSKTWDHILIPQTQWFNEPDIITIRNKEYYIYISKEPIDIPTLFIILF